MRALPALPLTLSLGLIASTAAAQVEPGGDATPQNYVERSMTLGQGELRADFAPIDWGLLFGSIGGRSGIKDIQGLRISRVETGSLDTTILTLGLGAGYGVTDELEVGALLLPLVLAPDGDFGDIELYGRYRFLSGDVEVGGQLGVSIPTNTNFGLSAGLPVLFHLGAIRIDTGVELELIFADPTNFVDIDIPVAASVSVADGFFVGVRSGLFVPDFDDIAIPLQAFAGYTLLAGRAPLADITATFGWPRLLWTGPGDTVDAGTFDIVLGTRFFFSIVQ